MTFDLVTCATALPALERILVTRLFRLLKTLRVCPCECVGRRRRANRFKSIQREYETDQNREHVYNYFNFQVSELNFGSFQFVMCSDIIFKLTVLQFPIFRFYTK